MMKFLDKDIRFPLACSLHEIGRIIGPELSKEHLFPCLDHILKDGCDELKLGSISHLTEFVEIFNSEIRENLIDVFLVLQRDPRKWRIRQSIASQIGRLSRIYTRDVVFQYIVPIAFKLCSDPVSEVRQEACKNIGALVDILKDEPNHLFVVTESIKGFAYSGRFNQRQSFIDMLPPLIAYREIFEKEIVPCLDFLCSDKVTVVRVVLAQFLASLPQDTKDTPSLRALREKLLLDSNSDVVESLTEDK